jgi:hypothetical protein
VVVVDQLRQFGETRPRLARRQGAVADRRPCRDLRRQGEHRRPGGWRHDGQPGAEGRHRRKATSS